MKKIKNDILATMVFFLPILLGAVAELLSRLITMDFIMAVTYLSIPVLIGLILKNK